MGRVLQLKASEHEHQVTVVEWAAWIAIRYPCLALLFAVPNGGWRAETTGRWLKEEGVRPGVPDLCLPVARQGYFGLFIEMKRPGEKPRTEQLEWLARLNEEGYKAVVCYGSDDAIAVLREYVGVETEL